MDVELTARHARVREALERDDEDVAAVENRNRQQVQQAEVEAQAHHQSREHHPSELR